jgi:hypothetical protein
MDETFVKMDETFVLLEQVFQFTTMVGRIPDFALSAELSVRAGGASCYNWFLMLPLNDYQGW